MSKWKNQYEFVLIAGREEIILSDLDNNFNVSVLQLSLYISSLFIHSLGDKWYIMQYFGEESSFPNIITKHTR